MKRRVLWFCVCLMMIVSMFAMPVSAYAAKSKMMKTTESVHLRDGSDLKTVVGKVKKGKTVLFTGKTSKKNKAFYQVTTSDGKTGYVFKLYLTDYGTVSKGKVYITTSKCRLYKSASTSSKTVSKLKSGRYLLVAETKNGWAYAKTSSGRVGYVQTGYLKKQ